MKLTAVDGLYLKGDYRNSRTAILPKAIRAIAGWLTCLPDKREEAGRRLHARRAH